MKGTAVLLVAGVAAHWWWRYRGPGRSSSIPGRGRRITGAGASADAHARELRTPLVRLATAAGIPTRAAARAKRFKIGAVGERYVAKLLEPLIGEGWVFFADCALPRSQANVDILAISPRGLVLVVDPKKWWGRLRLTVRNNRLMHGDKDVSGRLRGLDYEARTVSSLLRVPVVPVAAMVGPMKPGTTLRFRGIRLVPADDVPELLRALDRKHRPTVPAAQLVDAARRLLPPKTGRKTVR
ncbi:nuclease-related domain-containing protein [Streptomyces sp. NPDC056165]|uniref:nuclease-related domain-containing protein n=1 Tax=Streptomyces sp. NPDC056165 TaxID=3345733 RepID=UPI0035E0C5D2